MSSQCYADHFCGEYEFDECVSTSRIRKRRWHEQRHRKNDLHNTDYESYLEDYLMNQIPQISFRFFKLYTSIC
jgi:hypothetical protein